MINIKKINIELLVSVIFSLLMIYVIIEDAKPIWSHLNFINDLWSFEISRTWGSQLALTQNIVIVGMVVLVLLIVGMRIRQLRANR